MLRRAVFLACRQLTYRPSKMIATLSGICVAIILMLVQIGFKNALYDSTLNIPRALDADIILAGRDFTSLSYTAPPWFSRSILFEALGVKGVATSLPFYVFALRVRNIDGGAADLTWAYGLPMHQNSINNAEISRQMSLISQPDVVIFDRKSRNEFQSLVAKIEKVGSADLFFLNGSAGLQHIMKGRGLYTLGPTFTVDGTFVTSDINFNRITGQPLDRVSVGLIKVSPNSNVQEVKAQLQAMFSNRAHVFLKSEFIENERRYYSEKTPIGYLVGVGLVMGIVVGIVFIHQALHNVIEDHMNEYAVMRTMGYRQSFFIMLTSSITFLFTMIAFLPSLAIALLINNMVTQSIQLQVALNLPDLILVLLILFVMGGVATTLAIRKLEKANPVDLFL